MTVRLVRNEPSEEVTVGVVTGLGRLAELGGQELTVPVLFQQLPFEVQRDLRTLLRGVLVRASRTIEEPYRKIGAVKLYADPAVENPVAGCGELVHYPAKGLLVGKLRPLSNAKGRLPPLRPLEELVRAR